MKQNARHRGRGAAHAVSNERVFELKKAGKKSGKLTGSYYSSVRSLRLAQSPFSIKA